MALMDKIKIIPRRLLIDNRGWFLKVITGKEDGLPSYTGEVYLTMGKPGEMKGGHYHLLANEWFTMVDGECVLLLEDIVTKERLEMPFCFEDAQTVMIPSGVAHAFVNKGRANFTVLAYTDQLYDPADTIVYNFGV